MERDCGFLIQEVKEIYAMLNQVSPSQRADLTKRLEEIEHELAKANRSSRKKKKKQTKNKRSKWDDGT